MRTDSSCSLRRRIHSCFRDKWSRGEPSTDRRSLLGARLCQLLCKSLLGSGCLLGNWCTWKPNVIFPWRPCCPFCPFTAKSDVSESVCTFPLGVSEHLGKQVEHLPLCEGPFHQQEILEFGITSASLWSVNMVTKGSSFLSKIQC